MSSRAAWRPGRKRRDVEQTRVAAKCKYRSIAFLLPSAQRGHLKPGANEIASLARSNLQIPGQDTYKHSRPGHSKLGPRRSHSPHHSRARPLRHRRTFISRLDSVSQHCQPQIRVLESSSPHSHRKARREHQARKLWRMVRRVASYSCEDRGCGEESGD